MYLLYLYGIAEQGAKTPLKNTIIFSSLAELQQKIQSKFSVKLSVATLSRILNDVEYQYFFSFDRAKKTIVLNNDFSNRKNNGIFVRLTPNIYNLITQMQDNLLAKYLIYMIYACGITYNHTDFTASQFLSAFGYCDKANNYKDKISKYNTLIVDKGIAIIKHINTNGNKKRNIYSMIENEYK